MHLKTKNVVFSQSAVMRYFRTDRNKFEIKI